MTRLGDVVAKIRSKNAGPFWLTVDIFCDDPDSFARVAKGLDTASVAAAFATAAEEVRRFEIASLKVVKFSLPRPVIQGILADRDMHGASFAQVVSAIEI